MTPDQFFDALDEVFGETDGYTNHLERIKKLTTHWMGRTLYDRQGAIDCREELGLLSEEDVADDILRSIAPYEKQIEGLKTTIADMSKSIDMVVMDRDTAQKNLAISERDWFEAPREWNSASGLAESIVMVKVSAGWVREVLKKGNKQTFSEEPLVCDMFARILDNKINEELADGGLLSDIWDDASEQICASKYVEDITEAKEREAEKERQIKHIQELINQAIAEGVCKDKLKADCFSVFGLDSDSESDSDSD